MLGFNHSGLRGAVTGISRASWIKKTRAQEVSILPKLGRCQRAEQSTPRRWLGLPKLCGGSRRRRAGVGSDVRS